MAELNVKDPESSFTIDDWAATPPEVFETPEEISDMLHDKAVELVNLCIDNGVPALVHLLVAQDPEAHHCRTVTNLMPIGRTSTEMLFADYAVRHGCGAAAGITDLLREANNRRYPNPVGDMVDIEDLPKILKEFFGDK